MLLITSHTVWPCGLFPAPWRRVIVAHNPRFVVVCVERVVTLSFKHSFFLVHAGAHTFLFIYSISAYSFLTLHNINGSFYNLRLSLARPSPVSCSTQGEIISQSAKKDEIQKLIMPSAMCVMKSAICKCANICIEQVHIIKLFRVCHVNNGKTFGCGSQ